MLWKTISSNENVAVALDAQIIQVHYRTTAVVQIRIEDPSNIRHSIENTAENIQNEGLFTALSRYIFMPTM